MVRIFVLINVQIRSNMLTTTISDFRKDIKRNFTSLWQTK